MANAKSDPILINLAYAVMMFLAVVQGFLSPYGNWDMLCYIGSVISWGDPTDTAIHSQTLAILKSAVPAWLYDQHSRNPLSREAKDFVQVLPMCQIKPLYTGALWLVHQVTPASLATASWSVSSLSFGGLAVLLWRWRTRWMARSVWLILVLVITWTGDLPMASLARLSTPDALCVALMVGSVTAALFWQSFWLFALFGWLAALSRPDAVIFVAALTCYFAWSRRFGKLSSVGLLAGLALSQWLVSRWGGSYGWEKMFVYTFFQRIPNLAEVQFNLTGAMYWQALSGGFQLFIWAPRTLALLGLSALGLGCAYLRPAAGSQTCQHLLLVAWGALGLRFVIWPAWGEDRFYYGYYLLILYCSAELIGPYGQALWLKLQSHRKTLVS